MVFDDAGRAHHASPARCKNRHASPKAARTIGVASDVATLTAICAPNLRRIARQDAWVESPTGLPVGKEALKVAISRLMQICACRSFATFSVSRSQVECV
jgi:hypothetical protein